MDIREAVKWGFKDYFVGISSLSYESHHAHYTVHEFRFPNGRRALVTKAVYFNGAPVVWGVSVVNPDGSSDTLEKAVMTDTVAHTKEGIYSVLKEAQRGHT